MFSLNIIKVMIEAAIYGRVPIANNFNIFFWLWVNNAK